MKRASEQPQSWKKVAAIFTLASFAEATAWGHMVAFTPLFLSQELHMYSAETTAWTGMLASASMLVAVPLGPFWGVLADRYGRKLLILRSSYSQLATYLLIAVSQDIWMFLAARVLIGFAFGSSALMIAAIVAHAPERRAGTAIGSFTSSWPVAASISPLAGALLARQVGLRGLFLIDAGLVVLSILCTSFLFRDAGSRDRVTPIREKLAAAGRRVVTVPPIKWNFITWSFTALGMVTVEPFVPLLLEREARVAGLDPRDTIGVVLAIGGILTAIVTPLSGPIVDRLGATRLVPLVGLSGALIMLALALPFGLYWVVGLLLLAVVPRALNQTAMYAHLTQHVASEFRSSLLSLSPVTRNAAMLVGPALGAAVSGWGLPAVLVAAAGNYLVSFLCALRLHHVSKPAATHDLGGDEGESNPLSEKDSPKHPTGVVSLLDSRQKSVD